MSPALSPSELESALLWQEEPAAVAHALASVNVPIFPLKPGEKIPLSGSNGFKDASPSPDTARLRWHGVRGSHGVGWVPAGCGLVVVDVDVKNGGEFAYQELTGRYPHQEPHVLETLSHGWHVIFADRPESPVPALNNLVGGIDIRGLGGYCVAAVGPTAGSKPFVYIPSVEEGEDWAPLPGCLVELIDKRANGNGNGNGLHTGDLSLSGSRQELARVAAWHGCDPGTAKLWAARFFDMLLEMMETKSAHDTGLWAAGQVVKNARLGIVHAEAASHHMKAVWLAAISQVPSARQNRLPMEWDSMIQWNLNRNGPPATDFDTTLI